LDFLYRRGEHHNAPRPDLILLDLDLPKYDGRQILEILKTDPTLHHIPIVVLTTSSAQEDILRSYKLHANAYITKPVDFDQYLKAVRQIDEFFVQVVRLPPTFTYPSGDNAQYRPKCRAAHWLRLAGMRSPMLTAWVIGNAYTSMA
jgi:CheY-like chemotaxis protein